MKNKALAAILAAMLATSLVACSKDDNKAATETPKADDPTSVATTTEDQFDPDVIGINEIPVGDSGPQTDGPLTVDLVYFQAVDMEHGSMAMPAASESDMHFEIDVATNESAADIGFGPDLYMPYLDPKVKIINKDDPSKVIDPGTMMPMVASDGPHYGNNIKLEPGFYDVEITIASPADQFMLHTGKDSSAVKGRFWTEPLTFKFENWEWTGDLL